MVCSIYTTRPSRLYDRLLGPTGIEPAPPFVYDCGVPVSNCHGVDVLFTNNLKYILLLLVYEKKNCTVETLDTFIDINCPFASGQFDILFEEFNLAP
jgi:hypothetical protein